MIIYIIFTFICVALALGLGIAGGTQIPYNWNLLGPGIGFGVVTVILLISGLCYAFCCQKDEKMTFSPPYC